MAGKVPPPFAFTVHPSTSPFALSQQSYVSQQADERFKYIATGALVFDYQNGSKPRLLLLQRAAGDSMPNRWEIPGGACDDEDESIMHGMARELWEEAGLKTTHVVRVLEDSQFFATKSGKKICKVFFVVQAEKGADGKLNVKLDPEEHQQFAWASQEEVKAKKVGDVELEFTTPHLENIVLRSFEQIQDRPSPHAL